MKRKTTTALMAFFVLILSSCVTSTDNNLSELEIKRMIDQAIKDNNSKLEFTQWEIVQIHVKESDWQWNNIEEQWEAFADLPELTEFIYENGAALGYVFVGKPGVNEVQKLLPYINTYYAGDDENGLPIIFTETISCDFQLGNPSTVGFFIKASDLFDDEEARQEYYFRIVLIW